MRSGRSRRATSTRSWSSRFAHGIRSSPRCARPGRPIFFRLKPDWKAAQAEEVRASCTNDERDAFVAVVEGRPVGFVSVALNAFNEGWG